MRKTKRFIPFLSSAYFLIWYNCCSSCIASPAQSIVYLVVAALSVFVDVESFLLDASVYLQTGNLVYGHEQKQSR